MNARNLAKSMAGKAGLGTTALAALFVVMWSSGFVGAKYGLPYAGTFTLLFWRYVLVVVVLAILTFALGAWRPMSPRQLAHHAVIGVLAHAVWLIAVLAALDLGVSPGLAAFVTALQPMVTAALAAPVVGERLNLRQWAGVAIGLASVLMVVGDKISLGGAPIAYLLPFLAVLGISAGSLIDRRDSNRRAADTAPPPVLMTALIHCTASLLVIAPFAWTIEGFEATFGGPLIFAVTWLALVVSLAAYGLMFVLLRRMEATKVSSLMYLSPPVTMVMGYLIFGDRLTLIDVAGLAVAAVAVRLVTKARRAGAQAPTTPPATVTPAKQTAPGCSLPRAARARPADRA